MNSLANRWQTIQTPEGKDLWLRMDTGQTQDSSPFLAEVTSVATEDAEHTRIGRGHRTRPCGGSPRSC